MTFFLFVVFFFLIIALGIIVSIATSSYWITPLFGAFSIIYILVSYYNSDKIVTAISGAKPADEKQV